MQQFFNQLLQFLQQGIAAIFRFVRVDLGLVGRTDRRCSRACRGRTGRCGSRSFSCSSLPVSSTHCYKVAVELWQAGERILAAFATLLGVAGQDAAQRDDRRPDRAWRRCGCSTTSICPRCRCQPSCRRPRSSASVLLELALLLLGRASLAVGLARHARPSCEPAVRPQAGAGPCRSRRDTSPSTIAGRGQKCAAVCSEVARGMTWSKQGCLEFCRSQRSYCASSNAVVVLHADDDAQAVGKAHVGIALAELAEELQAVGGDVVGLGGRQIEIHLAQPALGQNRKPRRAVDQHEIVGAARFVPAGCAPRGAGASRVPPWRPRARTASGGRRPASGRPCVRRRRPTRRSTRTTSRAPAASFRTTAMR